MQGALFIMTLQLKSDLHSICHHYVGVGSFQTIIWNEKV